LPRLYAPSTSSNDCFDGGDDDDRCDDGDGWYDANNDHSSYDVNWGEHESTRNSCDQWGSRFQTSSWWHHSTPTIELAWGPVNGAIYYNVYRSTVSGGPYTGIASTPGPAYTDADIVEDTAYYYVITAVDGDGFESVPSVETGQLVPSATATPVATIPIVAPTGLTASFRQSGPAVDLTWWPVEGAVYYNIYRGDVAGGPYEGIGSSDAASFEDPWVTEGATYYYRVTAVDGFQVQSLDSDEAAVTTISAIPGETSPPEVTPEPSPEATTTPTAEPSPTATPSPAPEPTAGPGP
jgi:fibronectin type 3 domain-containing protein